MNVGTVRELPVLCIIDRRDGRFANRPYPDGAVATLVATNLYLAKNQPIGAQPLRCIYTSNGEPCGG